MESVKAGAFRNQSDSIVQRLKRLFRQLRAEWAVSRIRSRARRYALDEMTMDEIDAEIQAARAERKRCES